MISKVLAALAFFYFVFYVTRVASVNIQTSQPFDCLMVNLILPS